MENNYIVRKYRLSRDERSNGVLTYEATKKYA